MRPLDPKKILMLLCKVLNTHVSTVLWETPPPEGKPVKDAEKKEIAADLADMVKTAEGKIELSSIRDEICERIDKEYHYDCTLGVAALQDGSFGVTVGDLRDYVIAISTPLE